MFGAIKALYDLMTPLPSKPEPKPLVRKTLSSEDLLTPAKFAKLFPFLNQTPILLDSISHYGNIKLFCRRLSFKDKLFKKRTMHPLIQRLGRFRLGRVNTNVRSDGAAKPPKNIRLFIAEETWSRTDAFIYLTAA